MRAYSPGRLPLAAMSALVEASHYTLKLAERAAAEGYARVAKGRGKGRRKGGKAAAEGGSDGEDGDAGGRGAPQRDMPPSEQPFDAAKYVSEFVHPTVVQVRPFECGARQSALQM